MTGVEFVRTAVFCLRNGIFLGCLLWAAVSDLKTMRIPNGSIVIPVIAWITAGVVFDGFPEMLPYAAAAVICGGGLRLLAYMLDRILKKPSLGGGDIKLLAVSALYLGPGRILPAMLTAGVSALIFVMIRRPGAGSRAFPFGPWIALGTALMLLIPGLPA